MNPRVRVLSSWLVVFSLLFATLYPDDALAFFDTDTLKTTGIIMGITFGVALVVVLVVGTIRDLKKNPEEDDDVWSQSPVLRTLGYRPGDFPFLGKTPHPAEDPAQNGLVTEEEINLFLKAKVDGIAFAKTPRGTAQNPQGFRLEYLPSSPTLSNPPTYQDGIRPAFSLWLARDRS